MASNKGKKVLIAEDELSIAQALKLKLTNLGYQVSVVHDGQDALELIDKTKFDLLLLDIMMPGKDGFEVLESLQKDKITLPVIVTTNLSQEVDKERVQELGAIDFLVKSNTSLSQMIEHINKYLNNA